MRRGLTLSKILSPKILSRGLLAALCLSVPGMHRLSAAAMQPPLEQAIKASFLFKFGAFVEWPASAYAAAGPNLTICVRGDDPFGTVLDDVTRGQRISGRPVRVRRLTEGSLPTGCHMLFAGKSATPEYDPFAGLAGQPVLTVSDQASGVSGAMIQFLMQNGRVRFRIDNGVARANGLTISSKLLGLAVEVETK